jgi:hypothetical protein
MMTEIIIREMTEEEIAEREAWAAEEPARQRKAVEDQRRAAYQTQSDPLFFGWQRGDNTEQEWLDAVQAVKDAYPYPEVTK